MAPEPAAAPDDSASISFSVSMKTAGSDGVARVLYSGESLRTGDEFWLDVRVFEPLHVYVLLLSPNGAAAVLYPDESDVVIGPGSARRVPREQDTFFKLDDKTGEERLLVVGSRGPLSKNEPELEQLVRRIEGDAPKAPRRASGTAPRSAGAVGGATPRSEADVPPPPPQATPEPARYENAFNGPTRGLNLVRRAGAVSLESTLDAKGVSVVPLVIRHVK